MPLANVQFPAAAAGFAGGLAPADCEDTPSASAAATATAPSAIAVIPRLPFIISPLSGCPSSRCPPSRANLNDRDRVVQRLSRSLHPKRYYVGGLGAGRCARVRGREPRPIERAPLDAWPARLKRSRVQGFSRSAYSSEFDAHAAPHTSPRRGRRVTAGRSPCART